MKPAARILTLLMALCLALPLFALAQPAPHTLVVASTTGMSGEFMSGMWGNNTSDVDIRLLLHDYPTVVVGLDEVPTVNTQVVAAHEARPDAQGNTVHTFTLQNNLRFSDGSRITARDYVFTILLESSPLIRAIGGDNTNRDQLLGCAAYINGETPVFSGVRLISENTFSLTVSREFLPYFYDLVYVQVQPYPVSVIAPGCEVRDDGQGAYMSGPFTAQLLEKTILDYDTGYLTHPSVSSGPYMLTVCDRVNRVATFELNPYYLGNREGFLPSIKRIQVREVKNADIAPLLASGEIHLVNKISAADSIDAVLALPSGSVSTLSYPRNGFAYLNFSSEREPTSSLDFRKAISHLVDRNAIISSFLRGYGQPVYAYYGLGQWMIQSFQGELEELDKHPYNPERAVELLEKDGWTLNAQGRPYDASLGGLRHKRVGDELKPLSLRMAVAPNNQAAETVLTQLQASLAAVGGSVQGEYLALPELLRQFYRQDERQFELMFLASNFGFVFDPYYAYQVDEVYQGNQNTSGLKDEHLELLAARMRQTPPGNKASFMTSWLTFQEYWSDVLPMVPLYTNTYYDAFSPRLSNYKPQSSFSWADAVIYASFADN